MGAEEDANITVDNNGYGLACGGLGIFTRLSKIWYNDAS